MPHDLAPLSELAAAVDLPALVEHLGAVPGRRPGLYHCPHPGHPDRHPSFTVFTGSDGRQRARCQSQCQWTGDAIALVQWIHGGTTGDAARYLRQFAGLPDPFGDTPHRGSAGPLRHRPATVPDTPKDTPAPAPLPSETRTPSAQVAARTLADYCHARGWPADVVHRFGLSVVIDATGRLRIRHPFTVPGMAGPVLATWQDRATWATDTGKYHAAKGRPVPLYGLCDLDRPEVAAVVVCEGPPDTITARVMLDAEPLVAAVGIPGASNWHAAYAPMFAGLCVVLATDADTAGDELAGTVAGDLAGHAGCVHRLAIGTGKDLTDYVNAAGAGHVLGELHRLWDDCPTCATWRTPPATAATPAPVHRCAVCHRPTGPTRALCAGCVSAEANGPHRWRQCTGCGVVVLAPSGRRCYLTPDCAGVLADRIPEGVPA